MNRNRLKPRPSSRRGTILLGVIVAIVIFSILGIVMVSFTDVSTFTHLGTYSASQAEYIAQSGYRYAAARYARAPNTDVDKNLEFEAVDSGGPWTLGGGQFDVAVLPYYFMALAGQNHGQTTLQVRFAGSEPDSAGFSIPASGILALPSQYGYRFHDYASRSITTIDGVFDDCTFNLSGGYTYGGSTTNFDGGVLSLPSDAPSLALGTSILPVTLAAETAAVASGNDATDDLTVADVSFFPPRFGYFEIDGDPSPNNIYRYERISGNELQDITVVKAPWIGAIPFSFNVTSGTTRVIAHTSATIRSIGRYAAGGPLDTASVYERFSLLGFIPGVLGAGGGFTFTDPGNNLNYWNPVDSGSTDKVGIKNVDGDTLINLYSSGPNILTLNDDAIPGLNFQTAWLAQNKTLSYDVQVKIYIGPNGNKGTYYMAGLSVRDHGLTASPEHDRYSVSFFRGDRAGLLNDNKKAEWAETLLRRVRPIDVDGDGNCTGANDIKGLRGVVANPPSNPCWCDLENGDTYLLLWKFFLTPEGARDYEIIGFINLNTIKDQSNVRRLVYQTAVSGAEAGELKNFNTLVIRLVEEYVPGEGAAIDPDTTARRNTIKVWAVPADIYPRNTVNWNYATYFEPSSGEPSWNPLVFNIIKYTSSPVYTGVDKTGNPIYMRVPDWGQDNAVPPVTPGVYTVNSVQVPGYRELFTSPSITDLSSYIFNSADPPEISLHTYFDSPSAQETSFDDFSLKIYTPGDVGQAEAVPEL